MIDDASPEPHDSGTPSAQAPESYFWPLVALVLVILPQVLVPGRLREEPPLIVPVIEATVFLVLLAVAAKPGPVPRCPSANPVSVRHPGLSEQRSRDPTGRRGLSNPARPPLAPAIAH